MRETDRRRERERDRQTEEERDMADIARKK